MLIDLGFLLDIFYIEVYMIISRSPLRITLMEPPETSCWEYPLGDDSWRCELVEFSEDINLDRKPMANFSDEQSALSVISKIYGNIQRPI